MRLYMRMVVIWIFLVMVTWITQLLTKIMSLKEVNTMKMPIEMVNKMEGEYNEDADEDGEFDEGEYNDETGPGVVGGHESSDTVLD